MPADELRELQRRLDQAYAHIELLTSRLVDIEQRLPMLMFEAGMVRGLKERSEKIERELARLDVRMQDTAEIWRGVKYRIDRQTGTLDDLLRRFEAWKTVGNELGEQVNAHEQRLERHSKMHESALKALQDVKQVLTEIKGAVIAEHEGEHEDDHDG